MMRKRRKEEIRSEQNELLSFGLPIACRKGWVTGKHVLCDQEKAAVTLRQAYDGEDVGDPFYCTRERDCYLLRHKLQTVFRMAAWMLVAVEIFRRPPWTYRFHDWRDNDRFLVSNISYFPEDIAVGIQVVCIFCLLFASALDAGYEIISVTHQSNGRAILTCKTHPRRQANRVAIYISAIVISLKILEILIRLVVLCGFEKSSDVNAHIMGHPLSTTSPLECLMVVLIEKRFRNMCRITLKTIPRFAVLLACVGLGMVMFADLGLQLFDPTKREKEEYFASLQNGLWTLLNVMNASNWPDPFLIAYEESQYSFFFYLSFLLVASWGLLNIVSGMLFAFFSDEQTKGQKADMEFTAAGVKASCDILLRHSSSCNSGRPSTHIPLDIFRDFVKYYCYHFGGFEGLRGGSNAEVKLGELDNFDKDFNMLMAVLYRQYYLQWSVPTESTGSTYSTCRVDNDSIPIGVVPELLTPHTDEWQELYIVPPLMPLLDLRTASSSAVLQAVKRHMGSSTLGKEGAADYHCPVGRGILAEMYIQLFLTLILQGDAELMSIRKVAKLSASDADRASQVDEKVDKHGEPVDAGRPMESPAMHVLDAVYGSTGDSPDIATEYTTRLFNDSTNSKLYFNDDLRQCWLASQFLCLEEQSESKRALMQSSVACNMQCFFILSAIRSALSSRMFDMCMDLLFVLMMVIFIFAETASDMMIACVGVAMAEVVLKLCTNGRHWLKRSYRHSINACIALAMLLALMFYYSTGHNKDDSSFDQIENHHSFPVNDTSLTEFHLLAHRATSGSDDEQSGDDRRNEIVVFEALLVLRAVLFFRNVFLLRTMSSRRRLLKNAFRRCVLGGKDVLFLSLALLMVGIMFGITGVKMFGGVIQRQGDTTYPVIRESPYGQSDYYVLNFNDVISAMGTLFALLLVSNMHNIVTGFTSVTIGAYAKTFFVCWYCVGPLLFLNLLMASFLTSFISLMFASRNACPQHSSVTEDSGTPVDDIYHAMVDVTISQPRGTNHSQHGALCATRDSGLVTEQDIDAVSRSSGHTMTDKKVDPLHITDGQSSSERLSCYESAEIDKTDTLHMEAQGMSPNVGITCTQDRETPTGILSVDGQGDDTIGITVLEALRRLGLSKDRAGSMAPAYDASTLPGPMGQCRNCISVIQYAAVLLHAAKRGRQKLRFYSTSAHLCFQLRHRFAPLFAYASWGFLVLSMFARPEWTFRDWASHYEDTGRYPRASLPMLPPDVTATISLLLLFVVVTGLLLEMRYMSQNIRINVLVNKYGEHDFWRAIPTVHNPLFQDDNDPKATSVRVNTTSLPMSNSVPLGRINKIFSIAFWNYVLKRPFQTRYFQDMSLKRITRTLLILTCLTEIGLICTYLNRDQVGAQFSYHATPSAWLCVLMILWFDYRSAANLKVLVSVLPRYTVVLCVFGVVIMAYAVMGSLVYQFDDYHIKRGRENSFDSFSDTFWTIFVSVSTAGLPNQIVPYYTDQRSSFIYFFLYLVLGTIVMLNLILVVVMAEYEVGLQKIREKKDFNRSTNLRDAFALLDIHGRGFLTYNQVYHLLRETLMTYPEFGRGIFQQPSVVELRLLVAALDVNGDKRIYLDQFLWILQLTDIKVNEEEQSHYLVAIAPKILASLPFRYLTWVIQTKEYTCVVDTAVVVLQISALALNFNVHSVDYTADQLRLSMAVLLLVDIVLKMLVLGPKKYWKQKWSKVNIFLTLMLANCMFSIIANPSELQLTSHVVASTVSIVRSFFFLRNVNFLFPSLHFDSLIRTIRRIASSVASLVVSFFCIMYIFALIGVWCFGGLLNKDKQENQFESLHDTSYGKSDYYALNFNTIASALVTLICLLHVSGWDVVCEGVVSVTTKTSRLYFVAWYLVGVLFLMNIVTSVFISSFVLEARAKITKAETMKSDAPSMVELSTRNERSQTEATSNGRSDSLSQHVEDAVRSHSAQNGTSSIAGDSGVATDASDITTRKTTFTQGGKVYLVTVPEGAGKSVGVDDVVDADDRNRANEKFMLRIRSLSSRHVGAGVDRRSVISQSEDDFL